MRRSASVSLDRLGADTRQVARDAARRAGVTVEEWLAGVMAEESAGRAPTRRATASSPAETPRRRAEERPTRAPRRRPEPAPVPVAEVRDEAVDAALDSVGHWMDQAEAQIAATARVAQEQQERTTGAVSEAIALIAQRLDALDRKIDDGRQASTDAAVKAVESLEARLRTAAEQGAAGPEARIEDMLRAFESRIAGLSERVSGAGPRPIGRRGRPAEAEVDGAVAEIRQRQRALAAGAPREVVREPAVEHDAEHDADHGTDGAAEDAAHRATLDALRGDIARIGAQIQAVQSGMGGRGAAAVGGLQVEIGRLRDSIAGLATSGEVGTLERAVRALATDVGRARAPADLAAIAGPVDLLRVQVGRLSEDVASNVHDRLAAEVDRLHDKIDTVARTVSTGREASALDTLFGEIAEIRARLSEIAGPDRIEQLVHSVRDLDARIAALRAGSAQETSAFASLRPLLEEIRESLKAPAPDLDAELGRRFEALDRTLDAKLEALRERASPNAIGVASGEILSRLEALDAKVERAVRTKEPVMPALREETAGMRAMLGELAQRIDHFEQSGSVAGGLDALEKQILGLAERLDGKTADPAIASLERSMADLVAQVATLREVEAEAHDAANPSVEGLKHDLASLRAHHTAANERVQQTMEGVHSALEQLVGRLAAVEEAPRTETRRQPVSTPAPAPRAAKPAARPAPLVAEPVRAAEPRPAARAEAPGEVDFDDVLLEPGAGRPAPGARTAAKAEPDPNDIKASFIAAARRAAQSAAAEAASVKAAPVKAAAAPKLDLGARIAGAAGRAAPDASGLVARMRATLERRRRPLLLGLAAVVLALGALQTIGGFVGGPAKPVATAQAPAAKAPADPVTTQAVTPKAAAEKGTEKSEARAPEVLAARQAAVDKLPPLSTERFAPVPAEAAPAGPKVAGMAALSGDLAGLPAGAAALKQAALEGDVAAVYDLAARSVEGRGLPRDPKLAARLFEKLAAQGIAPAQYRLGNQYEKAQGLPRDLATAKEWYRKAAEAGNTRAMHNLAVLLAESGAEPGKPDYAGAAIWFRKAAEYGVRDSQYNLAVLMARGLGGAQDLNQSYLWFAAAAAQGDDDAGRKRDDVGAKMAAKDLEAAKAAAAKWRAKAADPAANEMPAPTAAAPDAGTKTSMSLMGAPLPITPPAKRPEAGSRV